LFRLSAPGGRTHNRCNNEDGLQCPRSLAAWVESLMSEKIYDVPAEWAKRAYVDDVGYRAMHAAAIADPEAFWGVHGTRLDWIKPYSKVKDVSFDKADFPDLRRYFLN
jgi:hypothetical protein